MTFANKHSARQANNQASMEQFRSPTDVLTNATRVSTSSSTRTSTKTFASPVHKAHSHLPTYFSVWTWIAPRAIRRRRTIAIMNRIADPNTIQTGVPCANMASVLTEAQRQSANWSTHAKTGRASRSERAVRTSRTSVNAVRRASTQVQRKCQPSAGFKTVPQASNQTSHARYYLPTAVWSVQRELTLRADL